MSIIKKILIISIIFTMCLPLMCNIIYAHNVELDTEDIISFPFIIMGGSGTITVKDTITNYSLYFQAVAISDDVYAEIQKTKPNNNEQLKALKTEYEGLKEELDDLDSKVKAAKTELENLLAQDSTSNLLEELRNKFEQARTEFEAKRTQYNDKIGEYNTKLKELQDREKELTPGYDETKWEKLTDNKFQIDLTSFEGNVAHAVWIKLVTSDNKIYYDEATYELSGTKKSTGEDPTPTPDPKKEEKKLDTKLYVVKDQSETKYLENNQGYITKKIVESDPDKGEVTIELKLVNEGREVVEKKNTEIFLVVDNSPSMDFTTATGKTRKEIVLNAADQLVDSVYNLGNNIKVGLVDFSGSGFLEGASINNASVRQELTNNKDDVKNAINNLLERNTSSGTNIDAGLQRAEKNFSSNSDCNKVIILLTDGIPNDDVQGNHASNDVTTDDAKKVQETTKQTLLNLKNKGIYTITMLTGMDESDGNTDKNGTVYQGSSLEEELKAAERVFGTEQNPTADKYYLVKSANINNIITEEILNDVSKKINAPLNEVKIVDYFPSDITENFEFSYVGDPTKGSASDTIDSTNKTITWNIGTLNNGEEATIKYKLKIKDMQNENLLEKTISTNDKVVLTYKDKDEKDYEVILDSSPQIKLSEKGIDDPSVTPKGKDDPTIAPHRILPNTGLGIALIGSIILIILCGVGGFAKYHKLKDVKLK